MQKSTKSWPFWLVGNLFLLGVLGFYSTIKGAPPAGQAPFADAAEQRAEMIASLNEIRDLLKEQNLLLRGGQSKPNVTKPDAKPTSKR